MAGAHPSAGELRDAFRRVADFLEPRLEQLASDLTEAYRAELPGWADVPVELTRQGTRDSLDVVLRQFRSGEPPGGRDREQLAALARGWAEAGFALDAIARSFHVGGRYFLGLVRAHADELGLPAATLLAMHDTAWQWASLGAAVVAEVEREHAVSLARRDATRRADVLRDLAAGRTAPEALADAAEIYGLDLELPYVTVCAAVDAAGAPGLEAALRTTGATSSHRVFQAVADGELLAVAPRAPGAVEGATVAVGPPAPLRDAAASFAEARQVLATAAAFGLTGVVGLADLGPLTLVTVGDGPAQRLDGVHFGDAGDGFAEIERTVLTLLELGQSVEAAAGALHMHRNTVRYRVGRFREVTGLDLRRTEDVVTAWWLLKWRQARGRRAAVR